MKLFILTFAAVAANPGFAADMDVAIVNANGKPVRDAVVSVHLVDKPTPRPHIGGPYVVDQQDIQFRPFVSAIPMGGSMAFMNHDALRHHVYSFSSAKKFEVKLESKSQDRKVMFDKPGIVPLGCNIHDRMIAYVDVVDTPWAGVTDASGHVVLHGIPAGAVSIEVWHPYLRAPGNMMSRKTIAAGGSASRETFSVALRLPPRTPDAGY